MIYQDNCPICHGTDRETLYEFDSGIIISKCMNCGFKYNSKCLSDLESSSLYEKGYFSGESSVSMGIDYLSNSNIFKQDASERYKLISKLLPHRKCRILEIGSAAGFFLDECHRKGHEAIGFEISAEMCRYAIDNFHVNCINSQFNPAMVEDSSIDAATMWHVLEHIRDPSALLNSIYSKLIPSGHIFITVPNIESGNSKDHLSKWNHLQPEAHLNHFSPSTLGRLLIKNGFSPVFSIKSGGTGFFGKLNPAPPAFKTFATKNLRALTPLRKLVSHIMVNYLGRDDFITIAAAKS